MCIDYINECITDSIHTDAFSTESKLEACPACKEVYFEDDSTWIECDIEKDLFFCSKTCEYEWAIENCLETEYTRIEAVNL